MTAKPATNDSADRLALLARLTATASRLVDRHAEPDAVPVGMVETAELLMCLTKLSGNDAARTCRTLRSSLLAGRNVPAELCDALDRLPRVARLLNAPFAAARGSTSGRKAKPIDPARATFEAEPRKWLRWIAATLAEHATPAMPNADRHVSAANVAAVVKLEEKSLDRYRAKWPTPAEKGRPRHPALWRVADLLPVLKKQFPHIDDWSGL